MKRRCIMIAIASMMVACSKGATSSSPYAGVYSTTASGDDGADDEDEKGEDDEDEGDSFADSTSDAVEDPPESTDDGAPAESSDGGVAEESEGGEVGSSDDGFGESSEDDGADAPPSEAWGECSASACEPGSDCVGVDGLRAFSDFCSPQCETADDCFPPDSGDAVPVCAIDVGGAGESTHCALVCEVDGEAFGDCPNGMFCIDLPGQPTPVSICMWV